MLIWRSVSFAKIAIVALVAQATLVASSTSNRASAAPPTIGNLPIRGLQIGGTTTFVVDGAELLPEPKLVLPWPNAQAVLQPGATAQRASWAVTLPPQTAAGVYLVRVATAGGVSNATPIGVDVFPQQPVQAELPSLNVALHGAIGGDQRLTTRFQGKAGQRVAVDCESQRLGGAVRPVVRLLDARSVQIAWKPPRPELGGDSRLVATLPADGVYTIEVHDVLYRAGAPGFVRLKVGDFHYSDLAFPLGVSLGGKASLEFPGGTLPANARAEFDATNAAAPGSRPASVPGGVIWSGGLPRVVASDIPEQIESASAPGSPPQHLGRPSVAVSGRIAATGEDDRFSIDVAPGQRLQFEVQSRAFGSPLDGVLTVMGPQGNGLASGDDRPGTPDPAVDVTVPAGVDKLLISVRDLQRRGGAEFVYRLVVRDLARGDFSLTLPVDRVQIPAGGSQAILVPVARQEYGGGLRLSAAGLPAGVRLEGDQVPAGASLALVSLTAADGAAPGAAVSRLVGESTEGSVKLVRAADAADSPTTKLRPWDRSELAVAVTTPDAVRVAWQAVGAGGDAKLPLGGKLPLSVAIQRGPKGAGPVRLRLVTTQPTPRKTVKQNNMDVQVDDVDRALRLETAPTLAPEASAAQLALLVPSDLPAGPWGFAIVAEQLSADNQTVLASSSTPVRYLAAQRLIGLQVTSAATLEAKAGGGETGKVVGKVTREGGLAAPITITLAGLPEGYVAPKIEIPADQTDFTLPLNFQAGAKLGELKNVQIIAVSTLDPAAPGSVRVLGPTVNLNVVAGS